MNYRREIDGLRALAVLPVILFHAGFQTFSGGFVGVDVFFVISGYLITSILLAELQQGDFSIINFYERRARRILPALFFIMFVCLPFAWLWLLPQDLKEFSESLAAVSGFASNVLFWKTTGYFESDAALKPLLHTWSLAVEEQYYLFFPVLLMLIWRTGKNLISSLLVIIFVLSLCLAQWGFFAGPEAKFYLLPTRAWELLIGAFLAFYSLGRDKIASSKMLSESGGVIGFILILYAIFYFDNSTPSPSLYILVPTIGAGLIIFYSSSETAVGKLLGNKSLVFVGLLSYSAYLWHQPILAFAKHRSLDEISHLEALLLIFLTFILSFFSWRYVETPFRDKERFSRSIIFKMGLIGSLFFIAVGFSGHLSNGFENRFSYKKAFDGDVGHIDFHKYVADKYFRCTPESIAMHALKWQGFLRCMQSKKEANVDIALLGDSHAEHLFIGLAESLPNKNIGFYIKSSYPFVGNPEFDEIFEEILPNQSIHTVLLTMSWVRRVEQIPKNTTLEKELIKTLSALDAAGKTVYLLDDIPKFPFPPERCKFLADGFHRTICDTPKSRIVNYEKLYLPTLISVSERFSNVHFLKIRDLLCGEIMCSMVKNSVLMYRDSNHLNILGSQYVGAEIVQHYPELAN